MNKLETAIKEMTDKVGGWDGRVDGFVKTIIEICEHYAEKLGYDPIKVFKALESKRTYSYPNYYQWAKFPKLDDITVFKNQDEMMEKMKPKEGFRCPSCKGISKNPYECDTGLKMSNDKICDWKSYGLFGTMGKGLQFTISEKWIEKPQVDNCFMPVAMEG